MSTENLILVGLINNLEAPNYAKCNALTNDILHNTLVRVVNATQFGIKHNLGFEKKLTIQ